jgi:hypothetical protein
MPQLWVGCVGREADGTGGCGFGTRVCGGGDGLGVDLVDDGLIGRLRAGEEDDEGVGLGEAEINRAAKAISWVWFGVYFFFSFEKQGDGDEIETAVVIGKQL